MDQKANMENNRLIDIERSAKLVVTRDMTYEMMTKL